MADTMFQGWRRPLRDLFAPWQAVPGAVGPTKAAACEALMRLSELAPSVTLDAKGRPVWAEEGPWQYAVWPEGQRPEGTGQSYRTREMKPYQ